MPRSRVRKGAKGERDLVARTIIELRRSGAFVRGHGLGIFQRAAGLGRRTNGAARNSEDLNLVSSDAVAVAYAAHWLNRLAVSRPV